MQGQHYANFMQIKTYEVFVP